VLVGIGFGLTAWAHDFRMLALTVVIWSIGEIISFPVGGAYVANLAPDDMRGRYMGFMGFVWSAGMILGPTLGTFIYVRSPVALWLTCGAAGLFAAVVISICPNEGAAKSEDSA
jgi:MFS family permease